MAADPRREGAAVGAEGVRLDRYDQSWFDRGRSGVVVVLWDLIQTVLVGLSPHNCYGWRRCWYRLFGAKIGKGVRIRRTARCNYPWRVEIGDHAWIGDEACLYALERITIGAHAVVSQRSYLCTGSHDPADPAFALQVAPIRVGSSAWVALGAMVLPGRTIGEGALIAAGAVLTRDAEPWTVYVGVPARAAGARTLRAHLGTPDDAG